MIIITGNVSRDLVLSRREKTNQFNGPYFEAITRFSASSAMPIGIARQLKKSHLRARQISEGLAKRGITVSRQWQKENHTSKLDSYPTQRKSPRSVQDLGD